MRSNLAKFWWNLNSKPYYLLKFCQMYKTFQILKTNNFSLKCNITSQIIYINAYVLTHWILLLGSWAPNHSSQTPYLTLSTPSPLFVYRPKIRTSDLTLTALSKKAYHVRYLLYNEYFVLYYYIILLNYYLEYYELFKFQKLFIFGKYISGGI